MGCSHAGLDAVGAVIDEHALSPWMGVDDRGAICSPRGVPVNSEQR
jgi:hypothetical protein